jgi:hypothetical protein
MLEESELAQLWLILVVGGLLIMMGQHDRSEALFCYFRLEIRDPENPMETNNLSDVAAPMTW